MSYFYDDPFYFLDRVSERWSDGFYGYDDCDDFLEPDFSEAEPQDSWGIDLYLEDDREYWVDPDSFSEEEFHRFSGIGLERDFDSMPRHSSRRSGIDDLAISAQEQKLAGVRLANRYIRNRRVIEGRSMARWKWKRALGSRRDRRWHRDYDNAVILDHMCRF